MSHIIEQQGSVSEFISFIQRMEDSYDRKNQYCGNWEMRIVDASYEFEYSPLEAAICHGKHFRGDLKFLEMLKKNNFLQGIDLLAEKFVFWAGSEMETVEALEFVLPLISKQPIYSHYDLQYASLVHDPIHYAIRMQNLPKLKVCLYSIKSSIAHMRLSHYCFQKQNINYLLGNILGLHSERLKKGNPKFMWHE